MTPDLIPTMETATLHTTADGQRRLLATPRRMAILGVIMSKSTSDKDRFYRALALAQRVFYASPPAAEVSAGALTIDPETGLAEIDIPCEYLLLCRDWHSGQDDLLYAVSSTGGLTIGSRRPYDDYEGRSLTDQEWHLSLWNGLESDIRHAADTADSHNHDDGSLLREFGIYCEDTIATLRTLYDLTDSEVV